MKPKLLFLLLFLFLGLSLSAQNYVDVVYLKNGSIIRGLVVEQVPNATLKIKTADGSIFVYQMAEVEKITKEESAPVYASTRSGKKSAATKGYKGFMEVGGAIPVSDNGSGIFSLRTSHGYQFNPYFYLGAGLSIDWHFNDDDLLYVPLFANGRVNFINNPTSPYFDLKIGYSPGKGKGFYMNPNFGVRFALDNRTALYFGFGYNLQSRKGHENSYCGDCYGEEGGNIMSAIDIKIGVEF